MNLIDTHSHIYYDKYKEDLEQVIERAQSHNIEKIICVGVDIPSSIESIKLAEKYDMIYATAGFHPHESKDANHGFVKELEELSAHEKVVAIGEIGLDFHYNHSDKKTQIKIFKEQLELSKSLNMPCIIHNRNADAELLECLKKHNINNAVIHCFASTLDFAKQMTSLNIHLSFTGLITFVKELEEVVEHIPLEKIMVETDSPYLTPVPNRGKRNEPYMVKYVAEKISEIKNIPLEKVCNQTTQNALNFFGI